VSLIDLSPSSSLDFAQNLWSLGCLPKPDLSTNTKPNPNPNTWIFECVSTKPHVTDGSYLVFIHKGRQYNLFFTDSNIKLSRYMILEILTKMEFLGPGPIVLSFDPDGKYPVLEDTFNNLWGNQIHIVDAHTTREHSESDPSEIIKVVVKTLRDSILEVPVNLRKHKKIYEHIEYYIQQHYQIPRKNQILQIIKTKANDARVLALIKLLYHKFILLDINSLFDFVQTLLNENLYEHNYLNKLLSDTSKTDTSLNNDTDHESPLRAGGVSDLDDNIVKLFGLELLLRRNFRPLEKNLSSSINWVYDNSRKEPLYRLDHMFRPYV